MFQTEGIRALRQRQCQNKRMIISARNFLRRISFSAAGFFALMALVGLASPCAYYPAPYPAEKYDPALAHIDSVDEAEQYIRSTLRPRAKDAEIADAVERFAANRFLHGFSTYSFCDNWLAYFAGGAWFNLKVPIDADQILRFPMAFCTQNATVMEALLERFSIPTRSVIFNGDQHVAVAALIEGRWALYDGDLEPHRTGVVYMDDLPRSIFAMYYNRTSAEAYPSIPDEFAKAAKTGRIVMTKPTKELSVRGRLFERVTWFLSWFGWALFLAAGMLLRNRQLEGEK